MNQRICKICNKKCKGERGLADHVAVVHPEGAGEKAAKLIKAMSPEDRNVIVAFLKEVHADGFYSYVTPCCPDNNITEAWKESGYPEIFGGS